MEIARILLAQQSLPLDGSGIHGNVLHYTLIFTLMGLALIAFIYFWSRGRLDMDDAPAIQMLQEDDYPRRDKNE